MVLGWGFPFLWAGVWAAITVPWVRSVMAKERKSWAEDSSIMADTEKGAPSANAPGPLFGKASESSTLRGSEQGRQDDLTNGNESIVKPDMAEDASRHSEGTTV